MVIRAVVWIQGSLEPVLQRGKGGEDEAETGPGPLSRGGGGDQLEFGKDGGNIIVSPGIESGYIIFPSHK
jgi:hypothetical protein